MSLCLCLEEDPETSQSSSWLLGTVSNTALVDNGLYWGQALSLHAQCLAFLSPHFVTCLSEPTFCHLPGWTVIAPMSWDLLGCV